MLIKYCFFIGENTVEAKQWLHKCYPDSAPPMTVVEMWYADFKRRHRDTKITEPSGRPNWTVVPENIKKVHKIVLANRKLKLSKIVEELKISESSVFTILHENLSMKKLFSK